MQDSVIDDFIADTLALTEATRDYILVSRDRKFESYDDPSQQLAVIQQSSRLTNLLANLLSWLMWCKAASAGEIGADELDLRTRELRETAHLDDKTALPPDLEALVARARELFGRILALADTPKSVS